jgi:hypothetical protein
MFLPEFNCASGKLYDGKFSSLHSSINVIGMRNVGRMRWVGHVSCAYKITVGKPEGKRLLQNIRGRREDNIKTIFK